MVIIVMKINNINNNSYINKLYILNIKNKDIQYSNKNYNSDSDQMDPAYRPFFPIKRIVIPEVYETIPNGQTYRFNINNPNDKVQVDKTDKDNIFTQQKLDGSWRIDYGKPRIDIHTNCLLYTSP